MTRDSQSKGLPLRVSSEDRAWILTFGRSAEQARAARGLDTSPLPVPDNGRCSICLTAVTDGYLCAKCADG